MFLFVFTEKKNILHFFYTFSFLIFWHLIDHAADVFFLLLTFRIESQNIYDAGGSGFLHPLPPPPKRKFHQHGATPALSNMVNLRIIAPYE